MNDKELLLGLKEGDQKAYQFLFRSYYSPLCTYAYTLVKDKTIAESIINDVIYSLWKNRERLQIEKTLRNYLIRAVKNRCINHFHQEASQLSLKNEILLRHSLLMQETAVEKLLVKELRERVEVAISTLPDQTQTIFRMSRFEQMKYQEIAEKLGISVDVVKYHIKIALASLRVSLKDYLLLLFLLKYF